MMLYLYFFVFVLSSAIIFIKIFFLKNIFWRGGTLGEGERELRLRGFQIG
jgi:hypothetical protein